MRTSELAILVVLVLLAVSPLKANASNTSANYAVGIAGGRISFSVELALKQNLTALQSTFTMPQVQGTLNGVNATDATVAVQNALIAKSPHAEVGNLRLSVDVSSWSNITNAQWFNLTLSYLVSGVDSARFGGDRVDMSWKDFVVASDILFGVVDVNNLGPKYIGGPAAQIASQQVPSAFIQISYRVDGRTASPASFKSAAATFTALNFSRLSLPLSSWAATYDFDSNSASWFLNAGSSLGMSIVRTINEPGSDTGLSTIGYGLFFSLQSRVSAPGRSTAQGDTVSTAFNDFSATIMELVIAGVILLGVGTFLYEKRVSSRSPKRRKQ